MNELTTVAAAPRPARPARTKSATADALGRVAKSAVKQGRAAGKKGLRAIQPVVESIKAEPPETIAKIVIAAVTSRLLAGAIHTVLRRPLATVFAVGLVGAVLIATTDAEAEATSA